jgi:hypothetical protein
MSTTITDTETLLAIDIGTIHTVVALFDVVEGSYRFIASAETRSTAFAPIKDIAVGVHHAVEELQALTGRLLIGSDNQLAIPTLQDGAGVDRCVVTVSAGMPLKVVTVGLLEDVSLESAHNLVSTLYAQVRENLSLNDNRKAATRLDSILRLQPDLIVIAGGTDGGASHSMVSLLEAVGLACYLTPKELRPEILYAGNHELADQITTDLGSLASVEIAPNIRPDLESEHLLPAQRQLADAYIRARHRQMEGVEAMNVWSGGHIMPTSHAFGRTIRYLSKDLSRKQRGVLGVDVGASATMMAAAFNGKEYLQVHPTLGLGTNLTGLLAGRGLAEINRWVDADVPFEYVRDYIYNKALYPGSIPADPEDLSVEFALACYALQVALKKGRWKLPEQLQGHIPGFLPPFETIVASGAVFAHSPSSARVIMTLLNALQPVGWSTLVLDKNRVATMAGAAADVLPLLTVQALQSQTSFTNLGMVIAPVGRAAPGTRVLRIKLRYQDESENTFEFRQGELEIIPLPPGQTATLHLQPLNRFDVGMGLPGRGGTLKNVPGNDIGIIVDTRGRPLKQAANDEERRGQLSKWLSSFKN